MDLARKGPASSSTSTGTSTHQGESSGAGSTAFFADLPVVKEQFHYIILAISVISVMPIGIEYLRARRETGRSGPAPRALSPAKPSWTRTKVH